MGIPDFFLRETLADEIRRKTGKERNIMDHDGIVSDLKDILHPTPQASEVA